MGLGGGYSEGSGEKMSEMTGLERLRALGREQEERSWSTVGKVRGRLMLQIAEQIEDERLREQLVVERVAFEMELHCLGVEGMEDSPVARWARELRDALDGHVEEVTDVATIRKDAYDAYEWVEAHGGLDAMVELSSRLMTVDALRAAIEETCTRIGVEHTGDLTQDAQAIWREIACRLMPKDIEWPRFEDGEPVEFGDEVAIDDGGGASVSKIVFYGDQWRLYDRYGCEINEDMMGPGERVKRPAPEDSWERLEEDCKLSPIDYCRKRKIAADGVTRFHAMQCDLVRRAKALAGDA